MQHLGTLAADPLAFFRSLVIPSVSGPQKFADCMASFQRDRFALIAPALLAVAKGERPAIGRYWLEATKGASKDSDLACCLMWLLAFSKRPLTCQVAAADRDQAGELAKACKDLLRLNEWLAARVVMQSWKIICRATGSEAEIISADIAGSHGARPDVLILNELSHIQKQEFAENLLDNSAKVPNGLVIIATNAGFVGTWQAKWRVIAETSGHWGMSVFSQPSPWLDDAHLEEARLRNSNSRYLRLWCGIWASGQGDFIDSEDLQACVNPNLKPSHVRQPGLFYVAGLDLGVKQDHSALVVVAGSKSTLQLQLVYAQNWAPQPSTGKVNLLSVERAVADADKRYGLLTCGYDPHQAALMAQRLSHQKVRMREMTFTGANLNLMASTMLDVFRSRRIELYTHPQLIADIGRLTITEKSYGYKLEATRNASGHADLAVALSICLPLAVAECSKVVHTIGVITSNDQNLTPYQKSIRREADESARELQRLRFTNNYERLLRERAAAENQGY